VRRGEKLWHLAPSSRAAASHQQGSAVCSSAPPRSLRLLSFFLSPPSPRRSSLMCSPDPSSGSSSGTGVGGARAGRGAGRGQRPLPPPPPPREVWLGFDRGEGTPWQTGSPGRSPPPAPTHTPRDFSPARGWAGGTLPAPLAWLGLPSEQRLSEEPPGGEGKRKKTHKQTPNPAQNLWFLHPLPSFPKPAWTAEPAA